MEIQDIIISNKLIAKFMKYDDVDCYNCKYTRDCHWIQCGLTPQEKDEQLKYHFDWNWLMPVVDKIESLETEQDGCFSVHISSNSCSIQGTNLWKSIKDFDGYGPVYMSSPEAIFETKLESTYYNVVEFIKWWNLKQRDNL